MADVMCDIMNRQQNVIERFYSLDVLRGLAALSVVLWHWQHFFFSGTKPGTFDVTRLPFYEWFFVLYTKGWLAVDLFFTLSGFIFYWLYSKRVSEGEISPSKFALLRFSRLYPLHFATLFIVAVSQFWLSNASGHYFVYSNNDSKHFLLNLIFASSWGFERGYSFNGPIWSVSVEVLLYALFFSCSRLFPVRAIVMIIISIVGFLVIQKYYQPIGRGIGSFFLGGCIFLAYQAIVRSHRAAALAKCVAILMISAWAATIVAQQGVDLSLLTVHSVPFLWRFDASFQWIVQKILSFWPVLVLFPLTILSLALIETHRGPLGRRVSFIGDISYSSYLLHFPLQLLFFVVLARFAANSSVYYSPWFMLSFFTVLIAVCFVSFRYFEMPVQKYLRQQTGLTLRSTGAVRDKATQRPLP